MMPSPPVSPTKASAQRSSKFTEGAPLTRPDFLSRTQTSNEHLFNILSEMDEFEKRKGQVTTRQRGASASSSNGSCPSPINHSFPSTANAESSSESQREEARLMDMGARRSLDGHHQIGSGPGRRANSNEHGLMVQESLEKVGKLGQKVKGRLRALTNESLREDPRKTAPYPGT